MSDRIRVINDLLEGRGTYLEIGVRGGGTYWNIQAETRVGVDPAFVGRKFRATVPASQFAYRYLGKREGTLLFPKTSDDFFADDVERVLRGRLFDCAFVDGLHTADQAYRDVDNALQWISPSGTVVMHDCNALNEADQLPTEEEARAHPEFLRWNGPVWRAVLRLRLRTDLDVKVLDTDTGLGIVRFGQASQPFSLTGDEVDAITYDEFAARRAELLNLVSVGRQGLEP